MPRTVKVVADRGDGEMIHVNGVDLWARRFGERSRPVLVAVHGGPTWDHSYLLPAVADLAAVRQVLLFDMRGHGRSTRDLPLDQTQPEHVVEDIRALADHLGADRVDLLGFSYGGSIAMAFADRHPGRLRSLILASACAYDDDLDRLRADLPDYRRRRPLAPDTDPAAFEGAPDGAYSRAMAVAGIPLDVWNTARWAEWRRVLDRIVFSDDWNRAYAAGALRRARPADPAATLRASGVPLLIVHGEHEMTFPVSLARRLHADVPGSEISLIPGAAHMAHFDNADAWVGAIRAFLSSRATAQREFVPIF